MNRLTEKQSAGYDLKAMNVDYCEAYCRQQNYNSCRECGIYEAIQKLAEYEDLEEQGLLLRLPCKVGTRIYKIVYYLDRESCGCCIDNYGYDCKCKYYDDENNTCLNKIIDNERYEIISKQFNFDMISNFGEAVFLTREEAEAKLKELEASKEICGATGLECIHCNAGACDNRRVSK